MTAAPPPVLPVLPVEPSSVPRARAMIQLAQWASRSLATYDLDAVRRIAHAAAAAAAARADELAERAESESGMGRAIDKARLYRDCTEGVWDAYGAGDFVSPASDAGSGSLRVPHPVGVVVVLTPGTNPVATACASVVIALLTRNAVVVSSSTGASPALEEIVRTMAEAAVAAGAPQGSVQVLQDPSPAAVDALTADGRVALVLTPGGGPAGTGPSTSVPVIVDASADLGAAAERIVAGVSFDHSLLPSSETVLIALDDIADRLRAQLRRAGAHLCDAAETDAVRSLISGCAEGEPGWSGRSAAQIAQAAGVFVAPGVRALITPIELVVADEVLARPIAMPVLAMIAVPGIARAVRVARAVLALGDAGGCAVHSSDPTTVTACLAGLTVHRVRVNGEVGRGFLGSGVDLVPDDLLRSTEAVGDLGDGGMLLPVDVADPWRPPQGPQPPYPLASNLPPGPTALAAVGD